MDITYHAIILIAKFCCCWVQRYYVTNIRAKHLRALKFYSFIQGLFPLHNNNKKQQQPLRQSQLHQQQLQHY